MSAGVSSGQEEVIWCRVCGIPHAAGSVHCGFCSRPLMTSVEVEVPSPESDGDAKDTVAPPSDEAADARTGVLARAVAERAAGKRPPRLGRVARWPVSRRPAALSDEEIETRAAAIVAQARAEEEAGLHVPPPAGQDGRGLLSEAETFAQLDFLPPLRERDQLWLIAGLFACALLILFAIAFVRFLAG